MATTGGQARAALGRTHRQAGGHADTHAHAAPPAHCSTRHARPSASQAAAAGSRAPTAPPRSTQQLWLTTSVCTGSKSGRPSTAASAGSAPPVATRSPAGLTATEWMPQEPHTDSTTGCCRGGGGGSGTLRSAPLAVSHCSSLLHLVPTSRRCSSCQACNAAEGVIRWQCMCWLTVGWGGGQRAAAAGRG